MEKDKRKKALQVACTVFVFVCVIFAMYKLTKLDEKNAIQRQKQEETQEKEDKINAKCEAIEYMDEYTENLQEQMRKAGIGDIRVTYKKCSRDYFDEYWGIDEYDPSDYFYYFILDYYSDSIDSIYAENTSNGDFEPFIKLMNDVRLVKDNREGIYEYAQEIQMGDKWIAVYIGDKNISGDITIKKEPDQTYRLEQNRYARWVYVNGQEVYAKSRETNSTGSSSYTGNRSCGSTSGSSSKNDPYDVYDYDDPDEFADEWGEEFGDGSYEDGYDDAYDYWEDEMD